jgi:hypothetical protein
MNFARIFLEFQSKNDAAPINSGMKTPKIYLETTMFNFYFAAGAILGKYLDDALSCMGLRNLRVVSGLVLTNRDKFINVRDDVFISKGMEYIIKRAKIIENTVLLKKTEGFVSA